MEAAAGLEAIVLSLASSDGEKPLAQLTNPAVADKQKKAKANEEANLEEEEEKEEEKDEEDTEGDDDDDDDDDDEDEEDEEEEDDEAAVTTGDEMQPIFTLTGASDDAEKGGKGALLLTSFATPEPLKARPGPAPFRSSLHSQVLC